jgi:hypothetical protein
MGTIASIFSAVLGAIVDFAIWFLDLVMAFVAWLGTTLVSFADFLVSLISFGTYYLIYAFLNIVASSITIVLQTIMQNTNITDFSTLWNSMPLEIIQFASLIGIPQAISIIITALAIKFTLSWIPL